MKRVYGEFALRRHVEEATPRRRPRVEPVYWIAFGFFLGMVATSAVALIGSGVLQ